MTKLMMSSILKVVLLYLMCALPNFAYAAQANNDDLLLGIIIGVAIIILGLWFAAGLLLGLLNDILDIFGPGMIPVVGDVFDAAVIVVQIYKYGPIGFIGIVELIPMVDIIPVFSGIAMLKSMQKTQD